MISLFFFICYPSFQFSTLNFPKTKMFLFNISVSAVWWIRYRMQSIPKNQQIFVNIFVECRESKVVPLTKQFSIQSLRHWNKVAFEMIKPILCCKCRKLWLAKRLKIIKFIAECIQVKSTDITDPVFVPIKFFSHCFSFMNECLNVSEWFPVIG